MKLSTEDLQDTFPSNNDIITETLNGLVLARDEFTFLTGSDDWSYWIEYPEYMIGSCVMRHLKNELKEVRIWPEIAPREISSSKNIRKGRIDIVVDDIFDNSRVIIEVKANVGLVTDFDSKKGIKKDLERICMALKFPKNRKLLDLGLFAFIANRDDSMLLESLPAIEKLSKELVESEGLNLRTYTKKIERGDKKWEAYAIVYTITKD